jgi:hypothetical protein
VKRGDGLGLSMRRKWRPKKPKTKRFRNADAERFLRIVKTRKKQERELEQMERSFHKEDLDTEFMRATAGI